MKHLAILISVVAYFGVAALIAVADAQAQNSPDCTACAMECSDIAQQCRASAEADLDQCADRCFDGSFFGRESCLIACWDARNSAVASCDRQESSCISNCYI